MSKKKETGKASQKGINKSVYLDKEAYEHLQEDAERQDRSISYLINKILREYYGLAAGKKRRE